MSPDAVTLHLEMFDRTNAGTLFGNIDERVVVVKWESHADIVDVSILSKMVADEMNASGADTLIYDMRRIGEEEGSSLDTMLRLRAIEPVTLKRVGWLVSQPELPISDGVRRELASRRIESYTGSTFHEVARALANSTPSASGSLYASSKTDFEATYGGSCYTIPELKTTVLRSAGNHYNLPLAEDMYRKSFMLHARSKGTVFIADTSAIAPVQDITRYTFAFEALIHPLCRMEGAQQLVHLRAGEPLFPGGPGNLHQLAQSLGVDFLEVTSMSQALNIIRTTQGRHIPASLTRTPGVLKDA